LCHMTSQVVYTYIHTYLGEYIYTHLWVCMPLQLVVPLKFHVLMVYIVLER